MREDREGNVLLRHDDRPIERRTPPALLFRTVLLNHHQHGNIDCDATGNCSFSLGRIRRV